MRKKNKNRIGCAGCIWEYDCGGVRCEDYSPMDGSDEISFYESDLKMRVNDYGQMIKEYNDGQFTDF